MEFSSFTFILTGDCNFDCSYCYQKKGTTSLDTSQITKALSFFLPYLSYDSNVHFTGGEPLLSFNQIKGAVNYIQDRAKTFHKKIHYSVTTNGSLINDDILDFLRFHRFSMVLSFDGLAQDMARKKGSQRKLIPVIEKILKTPDIKLEVNSVFTPGTIGFLSESVQSLIEQGIPEISFALDKISQWDICSLNLLEKELRSLRDFTLLSYKKTGTLPLSNFWKMYRKEIFSCAAGKDHVTMAPDGKLWGCFLFPDFFKGKDESQEYGKYCFGNLDSFIKDHEKINTRVMPNYANLRMDKFYTNERFCKDCPDLEECWACPVDAAFSSTNIGRIPSWTCEIRKIFRKERESFWRGLKSLIKRKST